MRKMEEKKEPLTPVRDCGITYFAVESLLISNAWPDAVASSEMSTPAPTALRAALGACPPPRPAAQARRRSAPLCVLKCDLVE